MTEARNQAEVEAATAKVNLLIQKYNINLELFVNKLDEERQVIEKRWPLGGSNKDTFISQLAYVLSKYNFVGVLWVQVPIKSGDFVLGYQPALSFMGLPMNVRNVITLFENLINRLRDMAEQDFNTYQILCASRGIKPVHGKKWKLDYLIGAVSGISNQLETRQREFLKAQYESNDGQVKTGQELVLVRGAEVEDYLNKHYPTRKNGKTTHRSYNMGAYSKGLERGQDMNIEQRELR
jgi:hypothetical protein